MVFRLPLVALLLFAAGTRAGRPRIAIEGERDELPANKHIVIPPHVQVFSDDTFHGVLSAHDVVVMYMREQHCPDCDFYVEHFYNATKPFAGTDSRVAFGQIDIHDEGDLFADWHGVPEDIPALLVFKADETLRYHKKPVSFVVNARMLVDLAPFVHRMRGPVYRRVETDDGFSELVAESLQYSDQLFFALWVPPAASDKVQKAARAFIERVAEFERYNSFYAAVEPHAFDALVAAYGPAPVPDKPVLVSYAGEDASSLRKSTFKIDFVGDLKNTVKAALTWVRAEKAKRPGHKYDNMVNYYQDDVFVPDNFTDASTPKISKETKRYVRALLQGRSSSTKVIVMRREIEFVTGENTTMAGIERGVVGMSVGMKRLLVLPPTWREPWHYEPIELHSSSQLLMEVTILHIGDTNEMPGRIEWETDPEKVEEHKRKVAEKERAREEAIARGEDPDAECKAKEAPPKQKKDTE
ncbi:hypothetical protein DIPPA_30092 [Diplonema papillatum]|nr:hypothetical protein DIPPA_30092 [Diplonema papillatum]